MDHIFFIFSGMKNKSFLLLLSITAISLMVIALYNGYPLVEGDTGAYIEQAIYPHFAADRPPFYGLFIKFTSMWTSLWFPVFAQCLILSFLLLKYIQRVNGVGRVRGLSASLPGEKGGNVTFPMALVMVTAILSFTCVAWVAAYLMPDIFAGILLLAVVLYLSSTGSLKLQGLYLAIIFLAISVHNSHFLIMAIFSFTLLVVSIIKKQKLLALRSLALICVSVIVYVTMCSMNAAKHYGFTFSRGTNIFMVAKLGETGILNTYLDENCGKKNFKLCNYKDQIAPDLSGFLWYDQSPLYKMGGWDSCREEYGTIAHDVLTTPRYLKMFVQKSLISFLKELTQIQAPDRINAQGQGSQPWYKVRQYYADEFREYNSSMQSNNLLSATPCNFVYYLFFILSSMWALTFYKGIANKELNFVYQCIFLFFIINAGVTSMFSSVIYRFQYRIFWILPATNAIVAIKYYWGRSQLQNAGFLKNNSSLPDF
jgi:hypothetical protein